MHYTTIALELLESHPGLSHYLRLARKLLPEAERYGRELKMAHLRWTEQGMDSMAALERAVEELRDRIEQEAERHDRA